MEIKAPYLPYDVLRERAEAFLSQHHPSRVIPVPIEEIVELQFQMDIVPEPGLHAHFDIDSYITADLNEIRVDEFVYESRPGRYRFSLAHELGHRLLHQDIFAKSEFRSIAEWKSMMAHAIPEKEYGYLEFHANAFAGLVLAPQDELADKYDEVRKLVESHGVTLQDDSEVAQGLIAEYLAGFFVVSPVVVQRRLRYDGHW